MSIQDAKTSALRFFALLTLTVATQGCVAGVIYENVGHPPLHVGGDYNGPTVGWEPNLNASMGGRELFKSGTACSQDVLKLVAWGDATQAAAAKAGGITEVVGVDFDNTAILGFIYTRSCTVVYGKGQEDAGVSLTPIPPAVPPKLPAEAVLPSGEAVVPTAAEPAPTAPLTEPETE